MNCPRCNTVIEDDSKFCKHCGRPIEAGAAGASPSEAVPAAPKSEQADKAPDVYRDPKYEKQVWEGRPAWRSYWGLWVLWAILSLIGVFGSYRWSGSDSALFRAVLLIAAGAAVALFIREALRVLSLRYRLTTQRLFIHKGLLTRVTDQLELVRVDDVRLRQSIVDRIVNTGSVEVIGTDNTDPDFTLESIRAPAEVAEALRMHVRGTRTKGTLFVENV